MDVGARVGTADMYHTYEQLGLMNRTGIDLPGEANSIMHKQEEVKEVDLAIMSFGQSFQITPMQLITAVSAIVNGGNLVTPHFGMYAVNAEGETIKTYDYPVQTVRSQRVMFIYLASATEWITANCCASTTWV